MRRSSADRAVAEAYGPTDATEAIRAAISPAERCTGATYRAQGLVGLRPEVRAVDRLTGALTLVDVHWAYLDDAGDERQHTAYRYLLRRAEDGQLGIQVVVDTTPARS